MLRGEDKAQAVAQHRRRRDPVAWLAYAPGIQKEEEEEEEKEEEDLLNCSVSAAQEDTLLI